MRYYYGTLHGQDPGLSWVHFANSRPWLDRDADDVDVTFQFVAPGAAARSLGMVDRQGRLSGRRLAQSGSSGAFGSDRKPPAHSRTLSAGSEPICLVPEPRFCQVIMTFDPRKDLQWG